MARTRQVLEQSSVIVKGPGDRKQKLTALSELLRGYLDTEALARLAAGKNLDGRSDAEVKEFLSLFHEFFVRTYTQRLLLFDAPDFAYGAETVTGGTARVATEVIELRLREPLETTASLRTIDGVGDVEAIGLDLRVFAARAQQVLPRLYRAISALGHSVVRTRVTPVTLDDVFLELTGKALRD